MKAAKSTTWAKLGSKKTSSNESDEKKELGANFQRKEAGCNFTQEWKLYDAEGAILGRLASKIAMDLMGKNKPIYTPHIDTGDYIVVINADKIAFKGNNKLNDKKYYWHTGYMGGIKERALANMLEDKPTEVLSLAVTRMLPKTKMGRKMAKKLKIYATAEHPHAAQQPTIVSV